MCKVSVVMPAYNCARFIGEAMTSVLSQTETDLELIVINDGSTDATLEIVKSIATTDSRVRVLSQPNSGKPSIARNRGLEQAAGEFICFLDGDDVYRSRKIQEGLEVFRKHPSIQLVFHDVKFIDEAGIEQLTTYLKSVGFAEKVLPSSRRLYESMFICNERSLFFFMCTTVTTILMSSVLIRRKRLTAEGVFFPENLTIGEDIDLWFRLVLPGGVAYMDQPLSSYRLYATSVTKRPDRNLCDPVLAHIKNYGRTAGFLDEWQRREYRRRIAQDLFDIGYTFSGQGRHQEALRLYIQSLRWRIAMGPLKGIVKSAVWGRLPKSQVDR